MNDDGTPRTSAQQIADEIAGEEAEFGDPENTESVDIDEAYRESKGTEPSPDHTIIGLDDDENEEETPPELPPGFHEVEE
jgi:hypothetical protein